MADGGEPTIDWASTISGQITDQVAGSSTLTLSRVIERITRDLETAAEDAAYGVAEVTGESPPRKDHPARDLILNALPEIGIALSSGALS